MTELYWDPFDVEIDNDPYPVWRRMREEEPVYRNDKHDFWALSRYDDVEAAHRDPVRFSSRYGTVLEIMGAEMPGMGMIINMDPPQHTATRTLVSRAFTPRRMAELEGPVREMCAALLDPLEGREEFDYVQDFAAQLPSQVISRLVGVPEEEREEQRQNIDDSLHIEPGVGIVNETSQAAAARLRQYLTGLVQVRAANPQDDLVSVLCSAQMTDQDGVVRRLTVDEIVNFAQLLYPAGTETLMRLLSNAAVILAEHPDQRADLVDHPELIANAVEELLRYEAPSPVQARMTTCDVNLHDVTIPAWSRVVLITGSAGRDERVYPDPDRFDVRREFKQHLSLGYGIHFCIGAALARLEGRIALEETLKRFPTWSLDETGVERAHTSTVRGYAHVPIRLGT